MNDLVTEFDVPTVEVAQDTLCILALDLGTQLGWSTRDANGRVRHGSISFHPRKTDAAGQRWLRFSAHLSSLKREVGGEFHVAYYENVMAHGTREHPNVVAAHVYGGFLACLEVFCDINRIRLEPVSVTSVKKSWTGRGNCNKDAMVDEARRRGFKVVDDNAADSLAILHYAIAKEIE
ncbi:polynucleotidyl transferase [Paraburkholderia sp. C35]|uniref:polynucleotidyl transferase n=1 Tax=Paraburkholderia sp. C35 TaxID=2126993 RepID=UPI000D6976B7|nr:polynucleotidyl transferase [Paraburkholderia sp. C35]